MADGEASHDRALHPCALEDVERPIQDAEDGMFAHFKAAAIASFERS